MKSLFEAILAFFTGKLNLRTLIFGAWISGVGFQKAASIAYKVLLFAAMAFFINYIIRIWVLFVDLVRSFQSLGANVGGMSYGISNSDIVNSFWGFIHESGLDDVILTSGTLFISLVSAFFGIQAYKLIVNVAREIYVIVTDGTKILPKP